jgi:basic membrane protein A
MTKTNKIGFVGGKKIPIIERFEYGYYAGAQLANPSVEILPSKYTDDWNNADVAKIAAGFLYSDGADIVFHAAGRAGLGVIEAAKEHKKYAIGVDSDQDGIAPGTVLTSMIKRVDNAVYQTISDAVNGTFTAGVKVQGLATDGVGYSDLVHTREAIGAENIEKLEKIKQQIIDGHILVPASAEEWRKMQAANP